MVATGLPSPERHLDAVETALGEIVYSGLTVESVTRTEAPPTIVCHLIPGGQHDGTVSRPHDDASYIVQTTCVGQTWREATYVWGLVQDRLLDGVVTVDGRFVMQVEPHSHGSLQPDNAVNPTLYFATPRWKLSTTPT